MGQDAKMRLHIYIECAENMHLTEYQDSRVNGFNLGESKSLTVSSHKTPVCEIYIYIYIYMYMFMHIVY